MGGLPANAPQQRANAKRRTARNSIKQEERKGMNFASPTATNEKNWSWCGGGEKKQSEWSTKQLTLRGKSNKFNSTFLSPAEARRKVNEFDGGGPCSSSFQ